MSAYFEAVKLDPMNIVAKLRLASEYASLGDTASARRGFEEAVRSAPSDAEAHYRYGAFLQAQHDLNGAIRELQTFVDLAPGKYPSDVVERTRAHITALRRANR
jgi:Tfp pilus assembly protein PilF